MLWLPDQLDTGIRSEDFELDPWNPLSDALILGMFACHPGKRHVHDSSLYGKHGSLTGVDAADAWLFSEGRSALKFDGVDDQVNFGDFTHLSGSSWKPFSASVRAKRSATLEGSYLDGIYNLGAEHQLFIFQDGDLGYGDTTGAYQRLDCNVFTDTSAYHHIAVISRTSTTVDFWFDGVFVGTLTAGIMLIRFPWSNVRLGAYTTTYPNYGWSNCLTDFALWLRNLNESEIKVLAGTDPTYGGWIQSLRGWVPGIAIIGGAATNRRRRLLCGAH